MDLEKRLEDLERRVRALEGEEETVPIAWKIVMRHWNDDLAPIISAPLIREMTATRKKKYRARVRAGFKWEEVEREFRRLNQFARDGNFLTFDWLMSPGNLTKLLEGNYRDREPEVSEAPELPAPRKAFNPYSQESYR